MNDLFVYLTDRDHRCDWFWCDWLLIFAKRCCFGLKNCEISQTDCEAVFRPRATSMKMGSSKRKSSFRIDDILHQQAEQQQQMIFQHQLVQNSVLKQLTDMSTAQPSSSTPTSTSPEYCPNGPRSSSSPPASPVPEHPAGPESPKKPTALYPNLLDFQKTNFPLHLQFGMSSFNPAALNPAAFNAAYLEQYANMLHKGEWVGSSVIYLISDS